MNAVDSVQEVWTVPEMHPLAGATAEVYGINRVKFARYIHLHGI